MTRPRPDPRPVRTDGTSRGSRARVIGSARGAGLGSGHEAIEHTADARVRAWAAELPVLYEEVAQGLAELMADVEPGVAASAWTTVSMMASDLDKLAYRWLNELVALAEIERSVIVATCVHELDRIGLGDAARSWRLRGRVGWRASDSPGVRILRHVKAATYHGLRVQRGQSGWILDVVLDI